MFTLKRREYIFTQKYGKSLKLKWNVLWATIWWASGFYQRASKHGEMLINTWETDGNRMLTQYNRDSLFWSRSVRQDTLLLYFEGYTEQPLANPAIMIPAFTTESQTALVLRLYSEDEVFGGWGWGAAGEEQLWRQYSLSAVVHWCSFCWGSANLDFNFKFKIKTPL